MENERKAKNPKHVSSSYILFATLGLIFLLFSSWYDGWWIAPLSHEEGKMLYEALSGQRVEDQVKSTVNPATVDIFASTDDGKAFYMLNLIKDKDRNKMGKK